ncbi:MAG: calcineurin-like phosphoesterase family protein [Fimbriimonadaceae bacterium]
MNRREFLGQSTALLAGLAVTPLARSLSLEGFATDSTGQRFAEGYVFHGSGARKQGQKGIAGVGVSNGRDVVKTDRNGYWRLPVTDDTILFVIKPSGWQVPMGTSNLPNYYYIHKPKGSPEFKYPGVAPTGSLPQSIDFGLMPHKESDRFKMVLFGDPQPRSQEEIDYMTHDIIEQLALEVAEQKPVFGLSLGDEMFDVLSLYENQNSVISTLGLPWYNTVGNHDMNYDALDDSTSTETFQRVFGPTYYAFNYGKVHFIVLDDVIWHGKDAAGYHGEITERQLEFVKNDLAHVPLDRLVVVAMHIPLPDVKNKEALLALIQNRPHTFSLSAHTHVQANLFLGEKDGWKGSGTHHHLNHATVCGSWWDGSPDERGIPHATMADGAPNGYSIVEFIGNKYKVNFRAASRPASDQMAIWIPNEVARAGLGATEVIVNVYAGSERSKVFIKVGDVSFALENFEGQDPYYLELKKLEAGPAVPPGRKLPAAAKTKHLWKGKLPATLAKGAHSVEIQTTDMYGQTFSERRILHVV